MAPSATSPATNKGDEAFPCILTFDIPFPSSRLASVALQAISIDQELSPLVRRALRLGSSMDSVASSLLTSSNRADGVLLDKSQTPDSSGDDRVLRVVYRATTNRMLRVAVNGFFESLGIVVATMRELDINVAGEEWVGDDFLPADGLGADGAADGQRLKDEVDGLGRVQGLTEVGIL